MKPEQRKEVLYLYIGYFVTIGLGIIPSLSWYAVGALALQLLYAVIRYVGALPSDRVFRSHAFNYILAIGVSFGIGALIVVQLQAAGFQTGGIFGAFLAAYRFSSSGNSIGYVIVMIALEGMIMVFWPIVLIGRGLYLINSGQPVFGDRSKDVSVNRSVSTLANKRWLASAVMTDGRVVQFQINEDRAAKIIGRDRNVADIVVDDDSVSRRHARLDLKDGAIWISDLGSTNFTKVGDRTIGFNPTLLQATDKIQLGSVILTISAA